jgi:hypothetical protein
VIGFLGLAKTIQCKRCISIVWREGFKPREQFIDVE